jgi:hypothetical protein
MSDVGAVRHMPGLAGIGEVVDEMGSGVWVLERRDGQRWAERSRYGSRAEAETALDELAATEGRDLSEYRVRPADDADGASADRCEICGERLPDGVSGGEHLMARHGAAAPTDEAGGVILPGTGGERSADGAGRVQTE